jgi:hypothetical protein
MAHVITFRTARFDVSKEKPNPINPVAGESVLRWLRDEIAKAGYRATEPDTEDWGWYIDVQADNSSYLVGASGDADTSTPVVDWTIQVHKARSMKDKMLGRNKMASDDSLSALIERIVRADGRLEEVIVDRES